ncbi:MAG: FAD-dependent monooxygenase [Aphanocapsa sp. GSE-SYN-MK-11-07L]|jgi:2-polyprenyl-6-methoxyphenol hydroxylase-like FAD-dependent oxidoreductase|nr:FAD-dependent monooxygenase [Aphanocapsa sp. GSE-SYN-MK-11-07L]
MTQVVIVGAGPTGATLALLLVQRGISVKLVEASRNFQRVFRGEALMPSGLDALAQIGLSPLLASIPHRPLDAWEFWIEGRSLFRVDEPLEPGGQPCTLVSQPALLAALIQAGSNYANFEFVQGRSVQKLLWQGQRVSGVNLGSDQTIAAELVIGADGRNSIVRQQADLPLTEQSQPFDILWFKLADSPQLAAENVFYSILQGQSGFGLFRSSEGNLQVGWGLQAKEANDWKQIDWAKKLASASPAWLAAHFQTHADTIERPVLLSVVVGCCSAWSAPGVLLLGDAAHPMSPIRAQGINMALRDVIVAANHLVPVLQSGSSQADQAKIDAVLPQIQAERSPEISRIQKLQAQEAAQGQKLTQSALLRWAVSRFPPLLRERVRQSWLHRQHQLRRGVTEVKLKV